MSCTIIGKKQKVCMSVHVCVCVCVCVCMYVYNYTNIYMIIIHDCVILPLNTLLTIAIPVVFHPVQHLG